MKINFRKTPIRRNIVAHGFGIGVQLLNQVLLVPLYLHFWSTPLYSDWIVLTAISAFFSVSDIGLNSVTNNQFVISYATDKKLCRTLLANNYAIIIIVATIALLGALAYTFLFDITSSLGLRQLSRTAASYTLVLLAAYVFIGMWGSVRNAVYRAHSQSYRGVYVANAARLSEFFIILFSLLMHLSIPTMVTLYLLPRIGVAIYNVYATNKLFRYRFSFAQVDISVLKKIFIPSLSFMAFPLGNGIVYQGFTLVVNRYFGSDSVVLFNTTRTLCSFIRQLLATMQNAVWPEYSLAFGQQDISRMRHLHRKAFYIATIGALLLSVGVLLFGSPVYRVWTADKIAFNYPLVIAFLVVTLAQNSWTTSSVCLMATNKHTTLGVVYLSLAVIAIGVAIVFAPLCRFLPLVEYTLLIVHIPLSVYAIKQAFIMTEDSVHTFFSLNINKNKQIW